MAPMHWGKYYAFPPSLTYLSYLNQTKGPLDHYLDCDCRDTSQKSLSKRASAVFSACPTAFWSMSLLMGSVGFLMFGLPLCFKMWPLQCGRISRTIETWTYNHVPLPAHGQRKSKGDLEQMVLSAENPCDCDLGSTFMFSSLPVPLQPWQHNPTHGSACKQKSAQIWSNGLFLSYTCILNFLYWLDLL